MTIFGGVGAAQAFGPASGGKVTPINNVGTTFAQVVGSNSFRQSLTFHNPGTVAVYVGPTTTATGAANAPTLSALGGAFQILPGAFFVVTGECTQAWGALAASGTTNPLTVMESNIA